MTFPVVFPVSRRASFAVGRPDSTAPVVPPSYSAEAIALFARFTTPPTDPRKTLIDDLIVALKNAGVWSKYDAFYMCAAETAQAAQRNWAVDAFNLTEVSSPTFTIDRGYTPNGTTSYCDTGFNPFTAGGKFVQNDAYMGAWHRTANLNGVGTSQDIGNTAGRITRPSGGNVLLRANAASNITAVSAYAIDKAWSRTASNAWRYYESGVLVGLDPRTDVSTTMTSFAFGIGIIAAGAFGVNECSVFRFGSSLTTAEHLSEHNAIQTYMTAVGAA